MIDQQLYNQTRRLARELAGWLERRQWNMVLAESCTGGLAASILAQVPGISKHLCGSMVTYQEAVKTRWLGIDADRIRRDSAVSPSVTCDMAGRVLERTPEANFSVAITGHLQPGVSDAGTHALVAMAFRAPDRIRVIPCVRYRLRATSRINRQWEAARAALDVALAHLHYPPGRDSDSVDWIRICGGSVNFNWNHWL